MHEPSPLLIAPVKLPVFLRISRDGVHDLVPVMSQTPDFARNGYAIVRNVFSQAEVARFREEADRVAAEAGTACVRHLRSKSTLFDALARSRQLLDLIPQPAHPVTPVRSILFDKTPAENWPVLWHQDLTIALAEEADVAGYGPWSRKDGVVHVQPPPGLLHSMVTARIHLDDTPASNGALRVMPGSHTLGKIADRDIEKHLSEKAVVCECLAGDVVLMCPLILHASRRAETPTRRRVLHFEYARDSDLDPRLQWFESVVGRQAG